MMISPFLLTKAGMKFCLYSAVISLILLPGWGFSFPLQQAILIFSLATAITVIARNRGWMVIQVLLVHVIGLLSALLLSFQTYYYPGKSIFRPDLALDVFTGVGDIEEGFYLAALILSVFILWHGGVTLVCRNRGYNAVSDSFDRGIAVFALIFFLQEIILKTSSALLGWFSLYFIFSILTLGIIRGRGTGEKEYINGYAKIVIITVFTLLLSAFVISFLLLGLPYLTEIADSSYDIIRNTCRPFVPILVKVLRSFYGIRSTPDYKNYSSPNNNASFTPVETESNWLFKIISQLGFYIILAAAVIITIIIFFFILRCLIRWLFSRTGHKRDSFNIKEYFLRVFSLFIKIKAKLANNKKKATPIYKKLLWWGKMNGLTKKFSETPEEYSNRLVDSFPFLKEEIITIVYFFNREVYGNMNISDQEVDTIKKSWKHMKSYRHWLKLIKYRIHL